MLNLGVGNGVTITPFFTVVHQPERFVRHGQRIRFKVAHASKFAPYGLVAFELSGQADGGSDEGHLRRARRRRRAGRCGRQGVTVGIPVKLGFSLRDYYEANGEDNGFGYFDVGALFTVPFSSAPTKFGTWNLHGGVNFLALGDGDEGVQREGRQTEGSQVIASIGIGMSVLTHCSG